MAVLEEGNLRRPRLLERLQHGGQVMLVIAEAGYGKTSLLTNLAQESSSPVCWLSLSEAERDLAILIEALLGQVRQHFPSVGWQPEVISPDVAVPLVQLLNELDPVVIILDDYHIVSNSPLVQQFITRFLPDLPTHVRVLIASRTFPELPITKLVANGQLTALGTDALRFQPAEVRVVLARLGLEILATEAATLVEHYDGWITGILLDTYPRWAPDQRTVWPTAGHPDPPLFNTLAGRLFDQQSPAIQQFLTGTAVLDEITASGCSALGIGGIRFPPGAEPLLTQIQPATAEPTWRLHPLWRDYLADRLRATDPDRWLALHRQAASFYDHQGNLPAAIRHGLVGEEYPATIARMESAALEWFMRGRGQTLLDWVEALPASWRPAAPRLLLLAAKVLSDRSVFPQAQAYLDLAEPGLADKPEPLAELYNQRGWIRLWQNQAYQALTLAKQAQQIAGGSSPRACAEAWRLLGQAHLAAGEIERAQANLTQALALYREIGNRHDIANVLQELAAIAYRLPGQSTVAKLYLSEALRVRRALAAPGPLANVLNDIAYGYYLQGENDQALSLYEEGLGQAQQAGNRRSEAYILTGLADLWRDQAAWDRAMPLYESALILAQEAVPDLREGLYANQAIAYLRQNAPGLAALAVETGQQMLGEQAGALLAAVHGAVAVAQGQLMIGIEQLTEAITGWNRAPDWDLARAQLWLVQARILAGQDDQARRELAHLLAEIEHSDTQYLLAVELSYSRPVLEFARRVGLRIPKPRAQFASIPLSARDASKQFAVFALGRSRIIHGGREISPAAWRSTIAREIFFYLLFHGPASREEIVELYWPEAEPAKSKANFATLLHRARLALGQESVVFDGEQYRLGIEVWTDVDQFKSLVKQTQPLPVYEWRTRDLWQRAVDLVHGEFLADVTHNWAEPKRHQIRELYLEALTSLATCHQVQGDMTTAIQLYHRATLVDPLCEETHRALITCLVKDRQYAQAAAQFERLRTILAAELGATPSPETIALYNSLPGPGRPRKKRS